MDGPGFLWGYLFGHQQGKASAEQRYSGGGGGPIAFLSLELIFVGLAAYILISGSDGALHWHPLAGAAGAILFALLWVRLFSVPIVGAVANAFVSYLYFRWVTSFSDWVWGLLAFAASMALHYLIWSNSNRSKVTRRWIQALNELPRMKTFLIGKIAHSARVLDGTYA